MVDGSDWYKKGRSIRIRIETMRLWKKSLMLTDKKGRSIRIRIETNQAL